MWSKGDLLTKVTLWQSNSWIGNIIEIEAIKDWKWNKTKLQKVVVGEHLQIGKGLGPIQHWRWSLKV